jgi:hypothetical protein
MWDVHNGECLRTIILSNSPPMATGKFTKSSDFALITSLNSRTSLVDSRSCKVVREYTGYTNNEYLVDVDFTSDTRGDLDGFIIGSENGMIHRFHLLKEKPIDSLLINEEGLTLDLVMVKEDHIFVSGRSLSSVHKVVYTPAG